MTEIGISAPFKKSHFFGRETRIKKDKNAFWKNTRYTKVSSKTKTRIKTGKSVATKKVDCFFCRMATRRSKLETRAPESPSGQRDKAQSDRKTTLGTRLSGSRQQCILVCYCARTHTRRSLFQVTKGVI